mgnify:CR=1 FL=1
MINEIKIVFDLYYKSLIISCKDGNKKDILIKENLIKDFWHMSDSNIIKNIYLMLNKECPDLNKKYNYTYLISKYFINGGDKTELKIHSNKTGTFVEYFNNECWGKHVEGIINKFPPSTQSLQVLNNLPISCAMINKKYSQYFIDKITDEIKEFTERKTAEMKRLINDIDTLYGLKDDSKEIINFENLQQILVKTPKQKTQKNLENLEKI